MEVDLAAATALCVLSSGSPHLTALVDYMEVASSIGRPVARDAMGDLIRRIAPRGSEVLRKAEGLGG
jgi:hypothetical protein